jgi:hypothetical protein
MKNVEIKLNRNHCRLTLEASGSKQTQAAEECRFTLEVSASQQTQAAEKVHHYQGQIA